MGARDSMRLAAFFVGLALKEHGFPRLRVRPLVAELFLTENCNLRCVSCACWRTTTRDELSTEEWRDVIGQLPSLRVVKANFTGGEPLIRKDAIELMAFARSRGITRLHLNTNAIRLTPAVRDAVLDAGVRSFNISVDGPDAGVHDRIRGRAGAFETTFEHLLALVELRERLGLRIRMNFTVMRDNARLLPEMARLAQRTQVRLYLNLATDRTFLFRDHEVARIASVDDHELREALAEVERIVRADGSWLPRFSELRYIPRHFTDVVQRDLPCAESQLKLMIHSRGEVGGCWGEDPSFNVRSRSLADIITSPQFHEQRARLFRKECVGCGSNYSLNLRWRPGSYATDALWRLGARESVTR